jgi:hypothetical protein
VNEPPTPITAAPEPSSVSGVSPVRVTVMLSAGTPLPSVKLAGTVAEKARLASPATANVARPVPAPTAGRSIS